jgi:hypothetical protein
MNKEPSATPQDIYDLVEDDSEPSIVAPPQHTPPDLLTLDGLSTIYLGAQKQMVELAKHLQTVEVSMWAILAHYGEHPNPEDPLEHTLTHHGNTWTVQRANPTHEWDQENALAMFRLAYTLQQAEAGSKQQKDSFDEFQCSLERLLDTELVLSPTEWWRIIDDTADLYRNATIRRIDLEGLESRKVEVPELLLQALYRPLEATYRIEVTSETPPEVNIVPCGLCSGSVDDEDFYCRHCGKARGIE